jgi:hypothetical protein
METRKPLRLQRVESSAIRALAYDRPTRWLFVAYRSKQRGLYAYRGVTPQEWRMLHRTQSIGRYVNARIKPHHDFVRLDDETEK